MLIAASKINQVGNSRIKIAYDLKIYIIYLEYGNIVL